jgi:hypothetical protein
MMNVLLVEPNYKNKYPPLGLMKISRYHKDRGDYVYFYKGKYNNNITWDRVYIATLFTFDFDKVVDTINYYKSKVETTNNIYVGGILASLMTDELKEATKIKNIITGRLTSSNIVGFTDNVDIDLLPLDYDILYDTDYKYPAGDNYFGYTTRGCVNKCSFCAVPKLEGNLVTDNNIFNQITGIAKRYGDKRNLLLLDNNILALDTTELEKIVTDLNRLGFITNSPNYIKPLELDILIKGFHRHVDEGRCPTKINSMLSTYIYRLLDKNISKQNKELLNNMLENIGTEYEDIYDCVFKNYEQLREIEEKYSYKKLGQRYVDFNQGMDARQLTEEKMKIISKLPIRPFRIAYDNINFTEIYVSAIKLASKYGASEFSNYLLYNCDDRPDDLYERLRINIDLEEQINKHIYSFPMKYEPIDYTSRTYVGTHWNLHYLRSIKAILNVTKGVFSGKKDFFERAFGKDVEEYYEILSMPKDILTYRDYFENEGITDEWRTLYYNLNDNEKDELLNLLSSDKYESSNEKLSNILGYYKISYKRMKVKA